MSIQIKFIRIPLASDPEQTITVNPFVIQAMKPKGENTILFIGSEQIEVRASIADIVQQMNV